jgi:hypothetical protein
MSILDFLQLKAPHHLQTTINQLFITPMSGLFNSWDSYEGCLEINYTLRGANRKTT